MSRQPIPICETRSVNALRGRAGPRIDVVVPALNESRGIGACVGHLRGLGFTSIVVVDGGSRDATVRLAAEAGARVACSARGRGRQMNAGAEAGAAPILLFLHVDTKLPAGATDIIIETLARPGCVAGCFRLRFEPERALLRAFAWFSRFDTRMTTFGDQAYFVRRDAFEAVDGFPDWPLLEDVELRRRLKGLGQFQKARQRVTTSARRFDNEGLLGRQALNGVILLMHALGVSPAWLQRWYR